MKKYLPLIGGLAAAAIVGFVLWKKGFFGGGAAATPPTPAVAVQGPTAAQDNTATYLQLGTTVLSDVLSKFGNHN